MKNVKNTHLKLGDIVKFVNDMKEFGHTDVESWRIRHGGYHLLNPISWHGDNEVDVCMEDLESLKKKNK